MRSYTRDENWREKQRKSQFGKKRPPISDTTRKKMSDTRKRLGIHPPQKSGKEHYNWQGGISKNPYPLAFNKELKLKIRERDGFKCVRCGRSEREELEALNRVLCVNHIDFNKNNCEEKNLNTLCLRCNIQINREREYWTFYFNSIM